jgi:hypothetical protein
MNLRKRKPPRLNETMKRALDYASAVRARDLRRSIMRLMIDDDDRHPAGQRFNRTRESLFFVTR